MTPTRCAAVLSAGLLLALTGCTDDPAKPPATAATASHCTLLTVPAAFAAAHQDFNAQQERAQSCYLRHGTIELGLLQATRGLVPAQELLTGQGFTITKVGTATLATAPPPDGSVLIILDSKVSYVLDTRTNSDAPALARQLVPLLAR